jgi:hypothetical protein
MHLLIFTISSSSSSFFHMKMLQCFEMIRVNSLTVTLPCVELNLVSSGLIAWDHHKCLAHALLGIALEGFSLGEVWGMSRGATGVDTCFQIWGSGCIGFTTSFKQGEFFGGKSHVRVFRCWLPSVGDRIFHAYIGSGWKAGLILQYY